MAPVLKHFFLSDGSVFETSDSKKLEFFYKEEISLKLQILQNKTMFQTVASLGFILYQSIGQFRPVFRNTYRFM